MLWLCVCYGYVFIGIFTFFVTLKYNKSKQEGLAYITSEAYQHLQYVV